MASRTSDRAWSKFSDKIVTAEIRIVNIAYFQRIFQLSRFFFISGRLAVPIFVISRVLLYFKSLTFLPLPTVHIHTYIHTHTYLHTHIYIHMRAGGIEWN